MGEGRGKRVGVHSAGQGVARDLCDLVSGQEEGKENLAAPENEEGRVAYTQRLGHGNALHTETGRSAEGSGQVTRMRNWARGSGV